MGNTLECTQTGENFLNRTLMTQALRSRISKLDHMKLNSFLYTKDTVNSTKKKKRQPTIEKRTSLTLQPTEG